MAQNCYGFVLDVEQRLDAWQNLEYEPSQIFEKAWEFARELCDPNDPRFNKFEANFIVYELACAFCEKHGYKIINNRLIGDMPQGTIALRVKFGVFSDFHFAKKTKLAGETCWLHKPGYLPVDMMFDEDILSPEWPGGYNSDVIFMISD
jgi:hypothetical protein